MNERDVEKYLVKRVKAMGGEVRKLKWIGRRHAPDRLVMLPFELVFAELKAPGKVATKAQYREHERMRGFGLRVVVIDSLAGVEELLG